MPERNGFTLVELLMVVAIVALVGAAVVGVYGKSTVENARREMTLHEMGQIRDAFARFHSDNGAKLLSRLTLPESTTALPTAAFAGTWSATDEYSPEADSGTRHYRVHGMLEFYERFGLWALFSPTVPWTASGHEESDFVSFKEVDPVNGTGWRGPYIDAPRRIMATSESSGAYYVLAKRTDSSGGEAVFPQPATKYEDGDAGYAPYRVIYFEHNRDHSDYEPIYRRLFLFATSHPENWDEWRELSALTGNRRGWTASSGVPEGYPLNLETGAAELYTASNGCYFVELLNLDIPPRR